MFYAFCKPSKLLYSRSLNKYELLKITLMNLPTFIIVCALLIIISKFIYYLIGYDLPIKFLSITFFTYIFMGVFANICATLLLNNLVAGIVGGSIIVFQLFTIINLVITTNPFPNYLDSFVFGTSGGIASGLAFSVGKSIGRDSAGGIAISFFIALILSLLLGIYSYFPIANSFGPQHGIGWAISLTFLFGTVIFIGYSLASGFDFGMGGEVKAGIIGCLVSSFMPFLAAMIFGTPVLGSEISFQTGFGAVVGWAILSLSFFFRIWYFFPYSFIYLLSTSKLLSKYKAFRICPVSWDENIFLPLPYLDDWLIEIYYENKENGKKCIEFILKERPTQKWAVSKAYLKMAIFRIESEINSVTDLRFIRKYLKNIPKEPSRLPKGFGEIQSKLIDICGYSNDYYRSRNENNRRKYLRRLSNEFENLNEIISHNKYWYSSSIIKCIKKWKKAEKDESPISIGNEHWQDIVNNFVVNNPLTTEDNRSVFVGRQNIIKKIERSVLYDQNTSLFLYGKRRIGKTSTLFYLDHYLDSSIVTVYNDLLNPSYVESNFSFCDTVSYEICIKINDLHENRKKYNFEDRPFHSFNRFINETSEYLKKNKKRMLLMFDEYENFQPKHEDILNLLRHIIQHNKYIFLIITGSNLFNHITEVNFRNFFINLKKIDIGYLEEKEARQLLRDNFEFEYDKRIIDIIVSITSCHPSLLQAIAHELINVLNYKETNYATIDELKIAFEYALDGSADNPLGHMWDYYCSNEGDRDSLYDIIVNGGIIGNKIYKNKSINSLIDLEILQIVNNEINFKIPFFKYYCQKQLKIPYEIQLN